MDDYDNCPFCGCDDLDVRSLAMCDEELLVHGLKDEANEVGCIDMVECCGCFAQAPASRWNNRAADDITPKVRTMRALQIEYFRTRDRGILARSKEAERELDQLLSGFEQNDLFYSGGSQ